MPSQKATTKPETPGFKTVNSSPVNPTVLSSLLLGYDHEKAEYLVTGFTNGFSLGCTVIPPRPTSIPNNQPSAVNNAEVVTKKIEKERKLGRIVGPFRKYPSLPNYRISPLGVVPKKTPGEFRMIHNLSFPKGDSINDGIPEENSKVQYSSIQDAIAFIKRSNKRIFLGKVDVEGAFRIIPIRPDDRPLLGFHWDEKFYFDANLPMGSSSSCQIFESFSTALEWIGLTKLGISGLMHMLDDFLFMAPSESKCKKDMDNFAKMCAELGVPLAPEKTMGPATSLPFLGITLDTVLMEARLPPDKVEKCLATLRNFRHRHKVTLVELQSLVGLLNFACSVVLPGRGFLRRLIDLTIGPTKPYHHVRLTSQTKLDIDLWIEFLQDYNSSPFFLHDAFITGDHLNLYTDASGSIGYGAICGKRWFYGLWPESWREYNISTLELFPIVLSVATFGHEWRNRNVCFFTDNIALVPIINKQTSRDSKIMFLIRELVLLCLKFNVVFMARHVPGRQNVLADRLSRFQIREFRKLAPWADEHPTQTPDRLSPRTLGTL